VAMEALSKADQSPVTVADFGAQALIGRLLERAFPADTIVSEEDSRQLRQPENEAQLAQVTEYVRRFAPEAEPGRVCSWIDANKGAPSERFWALDPIDGTKGFLRNDQYAVALALVVKCQVRVAALACPALPLRVGLSNGESGVMFAAKLGAGAQMTSLRLEKWQDIHVSVAASGPAFRMVESFEPTHGNQELQESVAQAMEIHAPPLRMDSQAKYGALARGDAALYLRLPSPTRPDYRERIWDHAAGMCIVQEAGGRVSDAFGRPLSLRQERMYENIGVVATNGILHESVLKALSRAMT